MFKLFYPRLYVPSILEIKPGLLKKLGIKGIIFDLDNTIIRRDAEEFSPEVAQWLGRMQEHGFRMGIVSNNSRKRVGAIAGAAGLPAVPRAVKPWVRPFRQALKVLGTAPGETALVGDQIFTDIFGGNLAGLYTILVVPLEGKEFWGTRLFSRPVERIVLARLKRHPEVFYGRWD
ncbi:MAG: YqeG family HAD IIIA-type phosphatase [Pelotomaculum sp.]|uniref:Predicted hydrolase n=1 Tax=Pelotomaculum thermopropionicum (strain DSM 13744 / JCM 10971 / SI) TaxID=370438 RepID=A5D370_PELTS|nr:YqeG family HAD IIIA-type phosphatase [Pelotomaculum sp.]BAF59309.1 predicted hydrolase [Pelotomaculum thermopropionicum SI]